jgi:hypothetical protein
MKFLYILVLKKVRYVYSMQLVLLYYFYIEIVQKCRVQFYGVVPLSLWLAFLEIIVCKGLE